jgi:nucleolar protein 58
LVWRIGTIKENKIWKCLIQSRILSLSRYKLKFSPDKVDTMIVQAISLLDDLDKELNNYVMRCREWYGWHYPELGKIVTDNTAFVKIVKLVGKDLTL